MSLVEPSAGASRCGGVRPDPGRTPIHRRRFEPVRQVPDNFGRETSEKSAPAAQDSRAFACPGLFRIVPSKDGGICRIKLELGRVTSDQARAIGRTARQLRGGAIEATNRCNLQIRGIPAGAEANVTNALHAAGLGGADGGADDIRNVMISPLAGQDRGQVLDVVPLARTVLARLQADRRYHQLSPKFAILIDGGEEMARLDHPHDIWLSAAGAGTFALGFAGCPPLPGTDDRAACFVPAARAEDVLFSCLDFFLRHRGRINRSGAEISRFRHLLSDMSVGEILAATGAGIRGDERSEGFQRRLGAAPARTGIFAQRDGRMSVAALPPLGRIAPEAFEGVAALAETYAQGEIRMTPWQSVLLPNVMQGDAQIVLASMAELGFIADSTDPLAGMIACAGLEGCSAGLADVKSDARRLAALLQAKDASGLNIHLSGCSKSCAAPRPAQATLVAVAAGRYDVFWREGGAANTFGACLGADHDIETAAALLIRRSTKLKDTVDD